MILIGMVLNIEEKLILEGVKERIDIKLNGKGINLTDSIQLIKYVIEEVIIELGSVGKTSLIRSQRLIKIIHELVKHELVMNDIKQDLIHPKINHTDGELKLYGFLKKKNQDICVLPEMVEPKMEVLNNGLIIGDEDIYGEGYTEKILSINVRSQLSSIGKNIDTLYERTIAEALNLHVRCPKMVLGEIYLIPTYEYDEVLMKQKKIGFHKKPINIEMFINGFQSINNRSTTSSDNFKYERVCLLIVDFSIETPKIYNSTDELIEDGLLPSDTKFKYEGLGYDTFIKDLLSIYNCRFN